MGITKKLVWILVLIFLSSYAYADLTNLNPKTIGYFEFEEIITPYTNNKAGYGDFVWTQTPERILGIIGNGTVLGNDNNEFLTWTMLGGRTQSYYLNFWYKFNASEDGGFSFWNGIGWGGLNVDAYTNIDNGGSLFTWVDSDCTNDFETVTYPAGTFTDGQWVMLSYSWSGENNTVSVYKNATLIVNKTLAASPCNLIGQLRMNNINAVAQFTVIDELTVGNGTLTIQNMTDLFNGGTPGSNQQYIYALGTATNFTITASDEWNSTALTIFNASIDGVPFNTTIGTINTTYLSNDTALHNISVWAGTYFNRTYLNYNISSNLAAELHQVEACFNATEIITDNAVTINNFTIEGTTRTSCFNLSSDTYSVMAQKTNWFSKNQTFTFSALDNVTKTISNMSYANVTFYAKLYSGQYLSSFDLSISSLNNTWSRSLAGVQNHSLLLINNTFEVNFSKAGYASQTANVTVLGHTNHTFIIYESNSFNISVYNETSNIPLTTLNISIDIIDPLVTYNYTTDNGTLYVSNLNAGEIEIRYQDRDGTTVEGRTYFVTITNNSHSNIRLYLLDSVISDLVTLDLVDQDGQDLEDATIKLQRHYPIENLYRTVAMTKSNFNGIGSLDLVRKQTQANIFYRFIVEYQGEVKESTDPTEITALILYFTINTQEDVFTSLDGMENVQYSLTYTNATTQFAFTWSDTTGLVQEGCLFVEEHTPLTRKTICNNCTVSTSATVLCNVTDTGNLFIGSGIIETTTTNSRYVVDSVSWNFNTLYLTFGTYGVFLAILFIMIMASIGIWNPVVAVITTLAALVFSVIMGILALSYGSVLALVIIGIIAVIKMKT